MVPWESSRFSAGRMSKKVHLELHPSAGTTSTYSAVRDGFGENGFPAKFPSESDQIHRQRELFVVGRPRSALDSLLKHLVQEIERTCLNSGEATRTDGVSVCITGLN